MIKFKLLTGKNVFFTNVTPRAVAFKDILVTNIFSGYSFFTGVTAKGKFPLRQRIILPPLGIDGVWNQYRWTCTADVVTDGAGGWNITLLGRTTNMLDGPGFTQAYKPAP